jgi:hypothetical protein
MLVLATRTLAEVVTKIVTRAGDDAERSDEEERRK